MPLSIWNISFRFMRTLKPFKHSLSDASLMFSGCSVCFHCFLARRNPSQWQTSQSVHTFCMLGPWDDSVTGMYMSFFKAHTCRSFHFAVAPKALFCGLRCPCSSQTSVWQNGHTFRTVAARRVGQTAETS